MRMRRDTRFEVPGFDPFPQRDLGFEQFGLSRPALERVCRRRVEREPNIEFRPRSRVTEVIASPDNHGVAGVRFEDTRGTPGSLAADLVVDASGRASPTLRFLEATGSARPTTIEIGMDQAYEDAVQRAARFRQARPLPSRVGPSRGPRSAASPRSTVRG
jgi:2-polyprenyl-6-methoxyphenol hydroxylase-like FAD-dependent oxidoreductase